jgi:hypothetical protein
MSIEAMIEKNPMMVTVEDNGTVEIWDDRTTGTTQFVSVREYAEGLQTGLY